MNVPIVRRVSAKPNDRPIRLSERLLSSVAGGSQAPCVGTETAELTSPRAPNSFGTQPLKRQIHDRGGEERQELARGEPSDDGDAERLAQFPAPPAAEGQRDRSQHGGQCRHENGAESDNASLDNRIVGR